MAETHQIEVTWIHYGQMHHVETQSDQIKSHRRVLTMDVKLAKERRQNWAWSLENKKTSKLNIRDCGIKKETTQTKETK